MSENKHVRTNSALIRMVEFQATQEQKYKENQEGCQECRNDLVILSVFFYTGWIRFVSHNVLYTNLLQHCF